MAWFALFGVAPMRDTLCAIACLACLENVSVRSFLWLMRIASALLSENARRLWWSWSDRGFIGFRGTNCQEDIKKTAYHKQALKLHSDKNAGSEGLCGTPKRWFTNMGREVFKRCISSIWLFGCWYSRKYHHLFTFWLNSKVQYLEDDLQDWRHTPWAFGGRTPLSASLATHTQVEDTKSWSWERAPH